MGKIIFKGGNGAPEFYDAISAAIVASMVRDFRHYMTYCDNMDVFTIARYEKMLKSDWVYELCEMDGQFIIDKVVDSLNPKQKAKYRKLARK